MSNELGTFCLVLHSHLPWVARHGRWPVGEEWLYQAWAHSYLPVVRLLERMAEQGHREIVSLGITPVLAAQLDDPHCLRSFHHWLGNWRTRAHHAAIRWRDRPELGSPELAVAEHRASSRALAEFEGRWRHGASAVLRPLIDSGAVELLGGPATHAFGPLLLPELREFGLHVGLTDARLRFGHRPEGIWAPECAHDPGMEREYAAHGVRRFVVDGSALDSTGAARTVGDTDVVCFGRDTRLSEKVWSAHGYPAHPDHRDFHTFDHAVGLKPARITGVDVPPEAKLPYSPERAASVVRAQVADFVGAVVDRLREHRQRLGQPGLVVTAFDTELFGHWWREGPDWLEQVLRALPAAGVRVSTLRGALDHVAGPVELPPGSWGTGNDWRTWSGPPVTDIAESNHALQQRLRRCSARAGPLRDPVLDQALRETLLALAGDWAFLASHDTGAEYARARATEHTGHAHQLLDLLDTGRLDDAAAFATELRSRDRPFGHLDARALRRPERTGHPSSPAGRSHRKESRPMRVLMLSWEYPPVVVGGLGRHVHALARRLAAHGHEVVVLCRQPAGTDATTHPSTDDVVDGVRLLRVAEDPPHLVFEHDLVPWTLAMGHAMIRAGYELLREWSPDVVHAHDWLVAHPAIALADAARAPVVGTVHATEGGRHGGWLSERHSRQIHSVEWWLTHRADELITCSSAMRAEAATLFELDAEAISVLHNGIEPRTWTVPDRDVAAARRRHGRRDAPLLLFFGRLEWEKGVQDLLAALPRVRCGHPGVRVVIAGTGTHRDWLVERAEEHGVTDAVRFTGHLPDAELAALLAAADTVVVPSRYEPFGIVALEAAAAGTPLVASTAGGLGEVVHDGITGLAFEPGDVTGLARAIGRVLAEPEAAEHRAEAARDRLRTDFDWDTIAAGTVEIYARATRHDRAPLGRPKIATGNALDP